MKLVELLAKELSEWPESSACITQDSGGFIYGWEHAGAEYRGDSWYSPEGKDFGMNDIGIEGLDEAIDHKTSVVTRAQWQAERDRQKGGEWKRHRGGKQPVADDVVVEYKLRNGYTDKWHARALSWSHAGGEGDVMKYRVISQPQAEEVEVKDTTIGTLSYKVEIDTTEASQAIDSMAAKWDQVDGPLRWRDCVNELDAYIEKYTRERDALIERLASEGFALIPPVVTAKTDVLPFEEWQVGDVVEVTNVFDFCNEEIKVGDQLPIIRVDKSDDTVSVGSGTWSNADSYKFIRRP